MRLQWQACCSLLSACSMFSPSQGMRYATREPLWVIVPYNTDSWSSTGCRAWNCSFRHAAESKRPGQLHLAGQTVRRLLTCRRPLQCRTRSCRRTPPRAMPRNAGWSQSVQQVEAAGAQLHRTASHDPGSRRLQAVVAARQGGLREEGGSRLEGDLQEGRGAGLDPQAVACAVSALSPHSAHRKPDWGVDALSCPLSARRLLQSSPSVRSDVRLMPCSGVRILKPAPCGGAVRCPAWAAGSWDESMREAGLPKVLADSTSPHTHPPF